MSSPTVPSSSLNGFTKMEDSAKSTTANELNIDMNALENAQYKPQISEKEKGIRGAKADITQQIEEAGKDQSLTYEQRLKKFDVDLNEAMSMIDAMAFDFSYTEIIKVSKKVSAKFQLRTTRFNNYLADQIDLADPKKAGKMNQLMTELQLAGSLAHYGGRDMPELHENADEDLWTQALQKRRKFILGLPTPVFVTLCTKLMKFDLKCAVVFSSGYEENF